MASGRVPKMVMTRMVFTALSLSSSFSVCSAPLRGSFFFSGPSPVWGPSLRFSAPLRKIFPDRAPAAHRASRSSIARRALLVVSTTAQRPRMALMI